MVYAGCTVKSDGAAISVGANECADKRYAKALSWNNIWHLEGDNFIVDLTDPSTSSNYYNSFNVEEAAAVICDKSTGDLVLFTDGRGINGADGNNIDGGHLVMGFLRWSAVQGNLILQNPVQSNLYYVFALPGVESTWFGNNKDFYYFTVDINQGNINSATGKTTGKVISGPTSIMANAPEKMVATSKLDGSGYFLITHEVGTARFVTFEITGNGVNPNPVQYSQGVTILDQATTTNAGDEQDMQGSININQQGTMLAINYGNKSIVEIYQYNATTGTVGNLITTINHASAGYAQFSPDGTKIYIASYNFKQFDLTASNIQNSGIDMPTGVYGNTVGYRMYVTIDGHFIVSGGDGYLYEVKIPNATAANNACELTVISTTATFQGTAISERPVDLTQHVTYAMTGGDCVKPGIKGSVYSLNVPVNPQNTYQWSINQGIPPIASINGSSTAATVTLDFSSLSGSVELQCQVNSVCGPVFLKKTITISNTCSGPICTIGITTVNNEPTVLIPTCHPSVTLNATAGFTSYTWYKDGNLIIGQTGSTYTATTGQNQDGSYTVTGVNAQNCWAASAAVTVIDGLTITGDDEICPGEKAALQVNIAGVMGNYFVQWFQNGSTTSTTAPSGTAGLYSAMVVLPTFAACSLTTVPKLVDLLLAPSPYSVNPQGPLYICSSDAPVTLSTVAPSSTPVPISSYTWNTGVSTETISTNVPGYYNVTAQGSNGCSSVSNSVLVLAPTITITQHCNNDGTTKLTANQNINGSNYVWKNLAGATIGTTQSINVTANNTYTVTSSDTRCNATASTTVCTPSSTNIGINLVTQGDFNISTTASPICTNYAVGSDLTCSDATTTLLNAGNWPSNFKITSNAGIENLNKWTGTGFVKPSVPADIYCLIADGRVTENKERVWYQQVAVENCATYTFSVFVKNIIVNEAEVPNVSLKIGDYTIKSKTLYANSQSDWVELSGTWKATSTGNVEISVILDGGGWVGRDIAVDEIYFAKTNCIKATPVGRICNAVAEVGVDKYICAGQAVQIGDNQTNTSLTYSWTAPGYSSTAINPTVNPTSTTTYTLVVTDIANNCSATDQVTVSTVIPAVTITKDLASGCTATQVKASLFNGIPNPQYEWQVNGVVNTTNNTGIFSLTGIATGKIVRCRLINACGLTIYSNSITVGTSAPVTAEQTSICSGTSTQLNANMSGGTAPYTYTWTASTGAAPAAVAKPIVSPTTPTTYALTFKDANNCTFTGSVFVMVNVLPPVVTINPATACVGTLVWITASQGAGNSIQLSDPSFMNRTNGTGSNGSVSYLQNINAAGTGNFVAVSKNSFGCERTTVIPFTAYAPPAAAVVSISPNPICDGSTVSVSASWGVGNSGNLTKPSVIGTTTGGGNQSGFGYTAPVTGAGTVNFVSTNISAQGCSTVVNIPFTVLPKPTAVIQSTGTLICSGSPVLLSTDATIGSSYQWYNALSSISGATNASYSTATAADKYNLKVTGANGCTGTSTYITLTSSNLAAPRVHVDDAANDYCASLPYSMNVGKALQLNGTNQYVNVPSFNYPASGTTYGGPITVEFWINSTGSYNSAFSIGGSDNPNRAMAIIPHPDGKLYWDYGSSSGSGRLSIPYTSYKGKWTHVALVSAGNGGFYKAVYLNGVKVVSSTAASDGPDIALSNLFIGKAQLNNTYSGGMIDEFRIWNKVLSDAEVTTAMTSLYKVNTPNLVGSWGFDEASGTTVNNDIVYAQSGSIINGATRAYPTSGLTYTWSPSAYLNTSAGTTVIPNTSVERTYTVKGVDANGCSAYAQVVARPLSTCKDGSDGDGPATVSNATDWDVEVYPNPTEGVVHISLVNIADDRGLSLEVIGMDGTVVFKKEHIETNDLYNLQGLPSGLYLIRVKNGEEIKIKKVVVVK